MRSRIGWSGMVITLMVGLSLSQQAGADADADYKAGLDAFLTSDLATSMIELRKASEAGHLPAMALLGYQLDIAEENVEAVKWYKRAAEAGSAEGALGYGRMLSRGKGVKQNINEALQWITKSAEAGHGPAVSILAGVYRHGDMGMSVDNSQALKWLHKGVEINHSPAIIELARAYRQGQLGLTPNPVEAERLEKMLPQPKQEPPAKRPTRGSVR